MRKFKDETKQVPGDIVCDICLKDCADSWGNNENATLSAVWGYNSGRDGYQFDIHMCEICFGETLVFLDEKRKNSNKSASLLLVHNPLNGYEYSIGHC